MKVWLDLLGFYETFSDIFVRTIGLWLISVCSYDAQLLR